MNLHGRIAQALRWDLRDVRSMSLPSLRDLVRPVSTKLANEISHFIRTGDHIIMPKGFTVCYEQNTDGLWVATVPGLREARTLPGSSLDQAREWIRNTIASLLDIPVSDVEITEERFL